MKQKKKVAVILQPGYLPWLGFFEQMYRSDVFIFYDDVQYDKNGWRNRNRIKTPQGEQWLTAPVLISGQNRPLIKDVLIDNKTDWAKKHLKAISQNYSKAPFLNKYFGFFEEILLKKWERLIDLDVSLIEKINEILNIKREIKFSSQLGISGGKTGRLINICRKLEGTHFYEGATGKDYIDEKEFESAGVIVEYQDYKHPIYQQLYGQFIPYLSVIDLIFNQGERSLDIILNKNG